MFTEEDDDDLLLLQMQAKKKAEQKPVPQKQTPMKPMVTPFLPSGNVVKYIGETLSNVPSDAMRVGGGIIDLVKSVPNLLSYGMQPEKFGELSSAVGEGLKQEAMKYTDPLNKIKTEPISTAMDVSGLLGVAGKFGKAGNIFARTAEAIDPMTYAGKAVNGIGKSMTGESNLATRLETSALKQGAPKGKTAESFTRPAKTAINENLPPVWASYEKNVNTLSQLQSKRQGKLIDYSKRGSTIDVNDVKADILREKVKHKNKSNYKEISAELDDISSRLDELNVRGGYDDDIPVDVIDDFKSSLFKKAQGTFDRTQSPTVESKLANNKVGFSILGKIDKKHPDISPLGKKQRDLIELNEAIYARATNTDKSDIFRHLLVPSVAGGVGGLLFQDPKITGEILLGMLALNNPYAKHYGAVAADRTAKAIAPIGRGIQRAGNPVKNIPANTLNLLQNIQNNNK